MKRWLSIAAFGAAAAFMTGCQGSSEGASAEAALKTASQAGKPESEFIELGPEMREGLSLDRVREEALPRVLTATGKIEFNEDRTARVLAPLPGQVLDLELRVGDAVPKDAVLFSIRSREIAGLVSDLMQAHRDQELAEKSYSMSRDLYEHQAASRISFQQSEAEVAKTKMQVARAEEALRVYGLDPKQVAETTGMRTPVPVRSPLAGTVIERPVTPGQFVQADNTPLVTIADLSTVWVLLDVYESDVHRVHTGQRVEVTAAAYPDRRFTARVDRINDKVDPDTRTLKVRLLVSNPGNLLKPGMFITASLVLDERVPTVTVPAKALFTEGDRTYAYVAAGVGRFERRLVTATADGPGRLRVTSGIRAGETVLSDGALLVRLREKQQQQPD